MPLDCASSLPLCHRSSGQFLIFIASLFNSLLSPKASGMPTRSSVTSGCILQYATKLLRHIYGALWILNRQGTIWMALSGNLALVSVLLHRFPVTDSNEHARLWQECPCRVQIQHHCVVVWHTHNLAQHNTRTRKQSPSNLQARTVNTNGRGNPGPKESCPIFVVMPPHHEYRHTNISICHRHPPH